MLEMSPFLSQTWALIRRYGISLVNKPVRSLFRIVLWPMLLIGVLSYIVLSDLDEYAKEKLEQLSHFFANIAKMVLFFIIWEYAEWIIKDRSTGIKSLMISMGLKRSAYYMANIICLLFMLLPFLLAITILALNTIFKGTQDSLFAIILLTIVVTMQIIGFTHAATSIITSSKWSSVFAIVLLFDYVPLIYINKYMSSSSWRTMLLFLDTLTPFGSLQVFSISYMLNKNSDTIDYDPRHNEATGPTYLLIIFSTLWTVVYFIFARWFEEVCPWQNDSAIQKPCFCFGASEDGIIDSKLDHAGNPPQVLEEYFERRDENREVGIRVLGLVKMYNQITAVDDVALDIYKGETTLLLGHNGAGKSTLMNMILGLIRPTKGRVSIKGLGGSDRTGLGVCPQTSILDDELTVRQHLELFVDLKSNMSSSERRNHIYQTLEDINLTAHAYKKPAELSGGMKRKLSLGMAFIGKSNVLMLDEPSSGLDPDSRVFVWNAIRRYRTDRTVLLSTQHMEEADYLGDRIAIMSSGRIVCCGSSIFLNKLFGSGYKLRIECLKSEQKPILAHIIHHFDKAKLCDTTTDLTSTPSLPITQSGSPQDIVDFVVELQTSGDAEKNIIKLLDDLETNGEKFGIRSHGLKSSSIEDVMLNTGKYFAQGLKEPETRLTLNSTQNHIETMANMKANISSSIGVHLRSLLVKLALTYWNGIFSFIVYRLLIPGIAVYDIVKSLTILPSPDRPTMISTLIIFHMIYHPVTERATKFKAIQLTSQLSMFTYWLAYFIVEFILAGIMIIVLNVLLVTALPNDIELMEGCHLILVLSYLVFHMVGATFAFMMSMIISDPNTAVGYFYLINFSSNLGWFVAFLTTLAFNNMDWFVSTVSYLGIILLPGDAFNYILKSLGPAGYIKQRNNNIAFDSLVMTTEHPMAYGFVALLLQFSFYLLLLILTERQRIDLAYYANFQNIYRFCLNKIEKRLDNFEIDQDIIDETEKASMAIRQVTRMSNDSYSLIATNLSKSFIYGKEIIHDLSFTVRPGECFGLLGVNGAGKTTTFCMIAAQTGPDRGKIWANGFYADSQMASYRKRIGYDPQANPDMPLTVNQVLRLMARLRGVPEQSISALINATLELLDMSEHKHKLVNKLSGGTKRKLSLCMSLIGAPQLLALDEPTAGVDPLARRGVWRLLKTLRQYNHASIVISSHAMEECEAICDRISIMACGRLRCIGTFLHLRSKFARGCTLRVQISELDGTNSSGIEQINSIARELQQKLASVIGPSAFKLADKNVNSVTININDNRVRRSAIFRMMREFRKKNSNMNLSYILNDASLEDIFILLAHEQRELDMQSPNSLAQV